MAVVVVVVVVQVAGSDVVCPRSSGSPATSAVDQEVARLEDLKQNFKLDRLHAGLQLIIKSEGIELRLLCIFMGS